MSTHQNHCRASNQVGKCFPLNLQEEEPELGDTVVGAGSVKEMEAAVAKAKRLRNMLKSDLPSKV